MADQSVNNSGYYIPTTFIYKAQQIQKANANSPEFKDLLVSLYQDINSIVLAVNASTKGNYFINEFNTGQLLYNPTNDLNNLRPIMRTTVAFGALPATGSKVVAHGITDIGTTYSLVKCYGSATNPAGWAGLPIPFSSATALANNLELTVDATNVTITTGGTDYSAYTVTQVVLEYVKTNT